MESYQRRIQKSQRTFENTGMDWSALYDATQFLAINGYLVGSLDSPSFEIAIAKGIYDFPQKWHNFNKLEKTLIDGIMLSSDYRCGQVKVILFN